MKKAFVCMIVMGAVALFIAGCKKEEPKTLGDAMKEATSAVDAAKKDVPKDPTK